MRKKIQLPKAQVNSDTVYESTEILILQVHKSKLRTRRAWTYLLMGCENAWSSITIFTHAAPQTIRDVLSRGPTRNQAEASGRESKKIREDIFLSQHCATCVWDEI